MSQELVSGPRGPHSGTGWAWGPGALSCSACTWTDCLPEPQNTKELKGTKITAVGANYDNKLQEDQKANWHFWRGGNKNRALCMPPANNTPRGVDKPSKAPLQLIPGRIPTLTPNEEPAHLPTGNEPVTLFSLPSAAAGAPIKPWLDILSGLWSISIDWGGQELGSVTTPEPELIQNFTLHAFFLGLLHWIYPRRAPGPPDEPVLWGETKQRNPTSPQSQIPCLVDPVQTQKPEIWIPSQAHSGPWVLHPLKGCD